MKIVLIIIASLLLIGIVFMPKKKNIGSKLEKAKKLLKEGEIVKINEMLDEIIIFPVSGKYKKEYAEQLICSLEFLKEVCRVQNISKDELINPVIDKLKRIPSEGGKIDLGITDPLEQWVNDMAKEDSKQARKLIGDAESDNLEILENKKDPDFTDEVTDSESLNVINSVGSYILKRKYAEGISFIDEHMPENMGASKATLMDQKAALFFMDGKVKEATDIYTEILKTYPQNCRIMSSLAEGLVELGDTHKAVQYAETVIEKTSDKDLLKTCRKIVKKHKRKS